MIRTNSRRTTAAFARLAAACAIVAASLTTAPAQAQEDAGDTWDGLVRVEDARVALAYIDPDADFSVFGRLAILDPVVAFRSNWLKDQRRSRTQSVTAADMERIKADVAALFKEVLIERLEADDGYEIVTQAADDVLLIRPAIVDLDISAPATRDPGRSRSYAATAGSATLFLELYDSVTGDILGRAVDRQQVRRGGGTFQWNTKGTNTLEARRMFTGWADQLRAFLDTHYKG